MKITYEALKNNTRENIKIGNLNNFKESLSDLIKHDKRNQLNDLTSLDWIRHTNSHHYFKEIVKKSPIKTLHPATFEEELPFYYIEFFSKRNELIFDPFLGTGSTSIAANLLNRKSIGTEINYDFIKIAKKRFKDNKVDPKKHRIFYGDVYHLLDSNVISSFLKNENLEISFTITSPPYHNILQSSNQKKQKKYQGFKNYGSNKNNLEKILNYDSFLEKLVDIFDKLYNVMKNRSYLLINVKNYYIKVKYKSGKISQEIVYFAWDLANKLKTTRWIPCGEQIWTYPNKKLYPFGLPFVYLANTTHSYNLIFHKDGFKK